MKWYKINLRGGFMQTIEIPWFMALIIGSFLWISCYDKFKQIMKLRKDEKDLSANADV